MRPAVNSDLVPARDQSRGQMFGERFKPAIVRWNTTRSKNRNTHRSERGWLYIKPQKPLVRRENSSPLFREEQPRFRCYA
jgi:hypothetical protein